MDQLAETTGIPIEDGIEGYHVEQTAQDDCLFWRYLEYISNEERYAKDDERIDDAYRAIEADAGAKQPTDILDVALGQIAGEIPEIGVREPEVEQRHIDIDRQCQSDQSIIGLAVESYQYRHGHKGVGCAQEFAGNSPNDTVGNLIDRVHLVIQGI